jgi:DNA replication and repair protein RecF
VRLIDLAVTDFRNIGRININTASKFVVFYGDNGQGKTNIIESICALSTLKSFRTHKRSELIKWGSNLAKISGHIDDEGHKRLFEYELTGDNRKSKVDGKSPETLSDYFQSIRAIVFAPSHVNIVRGGPDVRRDFIDRAVFTSRPTYLETYRVFRKLLAQKGALLKSGWADPVQLDVIDEQLALAGAKVSVKRREFIQYLSVPFNEMHIKIANSDGASIRYRGCLGDGDLDEQTNRYMELLQSKRQEAIERGWDTVGPQRDDLVIELNQHRARPFASQGQARSLVLALKLSELFVVRDMGARPMFLLDDLSSELDENRRNSLIDTLNSLDVQCFISTTSPDLFNSKDASDRSLFHVKNGEVTRRQ